jgi:hypothetical protein
MQIQGDHGRAYGRGLLEDALHRDRAARKTHVPAKRIDANRDRHTSIF